MTTFIQIRPDLWVSTQHIVAINVKERWMDKKFRLVLTSGGVDLTEDEVNNLIQTLRILHPIT